MEFEEALAAMRRGDEVRRAGWVEAAKIGIRNGVLAWTGTYAETRRFSSNSCDLMSDDWEVVRKTFGFGEALAVMLRGGKVRRVGWRSDLAIQLPGGQMSLGGSRTLDLSVDHLLAEDWYEVTDA